MVSSTVNIWFRLALFAGLGAAAYQTGRWQSELEIAIRPEPRLRNAASRELAARVAARNKAEALYEKMVDDSTPAAKNNGVDLAKDLKGGLAKLAAMPVGAKAEKAYEDAFDTWAQDPAHSAAAAAVAEGLPDSFARTAAMKGTANGWAQADPQKCLDWATGLPNTDADVLQEALEVVANPYNNNRQPALAAQYVDKLQDATLRNETIQQIGVFWGAGIAYEGGGDGADPAAALDWLNQVATGDTYDKTVKNIFGSLVSTNPGEAASMLDKIPEPDVRDTMTDNLLSTWSQSDPDAALQWAQSLPDSEQAIRDKAMTDLMGDLARLDPVAIASLVENSPNPAQFLSSAPTIAASLAKVDPQAALTWVNNLPDGDVKTSALTDALVNMSVSDFSEAWNYAAANLTNDKNAIYEIVQKNPTEAAPLIGQLPTEAAQVSATSALIMTLAGSNPTQAAALLGQIPSEDDQIAPTSELANKWAVEDPQGFANWVNTLPPGAQHDTAVSSAVDAVKNLKLPAPEQAELLQSLNQALGNKSAP